MKNKKGISLIALVITIIILIILTGISIHLILGKNGIVNRTKEAEEETIKQEATEKINLKITTAQMNKYVEKQQMPTLQELADILCEDNEIQYVTTQSKVATLEKITVGNSNSIFTKLKNYNYEFEINSSMQLASINGIKIANSNSEPWKLDYANKINITKYIEKQGDTYTFDKDGVLYLSVAASNSEACELVIMINGIRCMYAKNSIGDLRESSNLIVNKGDVLTVTVKTGKTLYYNGILVPFESAY